MIAQLVMHMLRKFCYDKMLFHRIWRWINEEEDKLKDSSVTELQYVVLDLSGKLYVKDEYISGLI